MKYLLYVLMAAGFILTSCEDNQTSYTELEAELDQILLRDEMLGLDGFGDEGAAAEEYSEGLEDNSAKLLIEGDYPPDSIWTYRFGRLIEEVNRDVQYTHGEDEILAEIYCTVTGLFIVKVFDTTFTMIDSVTKPFTQDFQRKVRFEPADNPEVDSTAWRVKDFTIGVGGIGEKVAITKLEYFRPSEDQTTWESVFSMEAENVLDTFISREDIPTFPAWSYVRVEVTVSNDEPIYDFRSGEKVMMHFGRDRRHKARRCMFDNGEFGGDEVALDDVFTRIWSIHGPGWGHNSRAFRSFFDVIDFGTLFNTQEDVHTSFWSFPYRSIR